MIFQIILNEVDSNQKVDKRFQKKTRPRSVLYCTTYIRHIYKICTTQSRTCLILQLYDSRILVTQQQTVLKGSAFLRLMGLVRYRTLALRTYSAMLSKCLAVFLGPLALVRFCPFLMFFCPFCPFLGAFRSAIWLYILALIIYNLFCQIKLQ